MSEHLTPHQAFYQSQVRSAESLGLEAVFEWQVRAHRIQGVEHPLKNWHPSRKFEFDFGHRRAKVSAELQGGVVGLQVTCHNCHLPVYRLVNGQRIPVREPRGHASVTGLRRDYEKLNEAQIEGWLLLQFDVDKVKDGSGALLFKRLIEERLQKI